VSAVPARDLMTTLPTDMVEARDLPHWVRFASLVVVMLGICGAAILAPSATFAYVDWGQSSDMVAWEVFAQAVASAGASGNKQLEFETWASDDDIYAKSPPQWPAIGARPVPAKCRQNFDRGAARAAGFPNDGCIMEDVRRNWAAYRYIVSHELYSKEGLARAFQQDFKVDLPSDSVQIKADWVKTRDLARWLHFDEEDIRLNYYTKTEQDGATAVEYALISLHLNSKRWKNWLWATFEHRLNPGRCDDLGCHDTFGAATPHVNSQAQANQNYGDCPKSVALTALFANVGLDILWLNYCLKGSQVAFTKEDGRPTLLGNSVIDRINGHIPVLHSSCMTCHALASFGKAGEVNGAGAADAIGDVDLSRLHGYLTNGFVWGITKAR
jgi:hypothetical protein